MSARPWPVEGRTAESVACLGSSTTAGRGTYNWIAKLEKRPENHRFRFVNLGVGDSQAAHGFTATIALRLGENTFRVEIADAEIHLARGDAERSTATLVTDPSTLAALIYGDRPLDDAVRSGEATIMGKTAAVARLLRLVRLPEPANPH
jgi:alkyl sulfatase BDS1-like metallo-beta-lactamase superfamily hydrolase